MSRPGDRLRAFAARWLDSRTMERVVDPAVADLQAERASVRGYVALAKVVTLCAIKEAVVGTFGRTLAWSAALTAAFTLLLILPASRGGPGIGLHPSPLRFLYLVPQALVLSLTLGAALGLAVTLGGRPVSRRIAGSILVLSLAASVVSFVNVGWITPAANQAYRVMVWGASDPGPGIPEMTFSELTRTIDYFSDPVYSQFGYLHALTFNYHMRWALAWSPVVFAVFALAAGASVRKRWLVVFGSCVAFAMYWAAIRSTRLMPWNSGLPALAAAWAGNILVLVAAGVAAASGALTRVRSGVSLSA